MSLLVSRTLKNTLTNATCPLDPGMGNELVAIVGSLRFQTIAIIVAAIFTVIATVLAGLLVLRHARHLTKPSEQIIIIRIISIIPVFAILNFLQLCFYSAAQYIRPWPEVYEAICLCSFYMLLLKLLTPEDLQARDHFFRKLEPKPGFQGPLTKLIKRYQKPKEAKPAPPGGSLRWFDNISFAIFQYPIGAFIIAVSTDISQAFGRYCLTSNSFHFAHLWLSIFEIITSGLAITLLLVFYNRFIKGLKPHSGVLKLVVFKIIVFLNFAQTTLFTFLNSSGYLKTSSKLSYGDLSVGIPALIFCFEMALIAILFHYAFGTATYKGESDVKGPQMTPSQAILAALNPEEVLQAAGLAFRFRFSSRRKQFALSDSQVPLDSYPAEQGLHSRPQAQPQRQAQGFEFQAPDYFDPPRFGEANGATRQAPFRAQEARNPWER